MSPQNGLYWFRQDLRLHDQPALNSLCEHVTSLACIYVVEPRWFCENEFGCRALSDRRYQFLRESLDALSAQLAGVGLSLHVLYGDPVTLLPALIDEFEIHAVGVQQYCGYNEHAQLRQIQAALTKPVHWHRACNATLYDQNSLPFEIDEIPAQFTAFRNKIEAQRIPISAAPTVSLWPQDMHFPVTLSAPPEVSNTNPILPRCIAGERAGLHHLHDYLFSQQAVEHYKQTRNAFDSWYDSSKLSVWLADGSLSPRYIAAQLAQFEQEIISNDSTYWLFFELLWREFFHWQHAKHGATWFSFQGVRQRLPNTVKDLTAFQQWCSGTTGIDIVDACMRQLNATGYMSNRGRQLVASCLVHELNHDWRYGAAYFEQQLLDYDVASNWGNWQYLAGVGHDPRGHRHFDLEKQAQLYDPTGEFRDKWLNKA